MYEILILLHVIYYVHLCSIRDEKYQRSVILIFQSYLHYVGYFEVRTQKCDLFRAILVLYWKLNQF